MTNKFLVGDLVVATTDTVIDILTSDSDPLVLVAKGTIGTVLGFVPSFSNMVICNWPNGERWSVHQAYLERYDSSKKPSWVELHRFTSLLAHVGHDIECVNYGTLASPANVAIECLTCNEVLYDLNNPEKD